MSLLFSYIQSNIHKFLAKITCVFVPLENHVIITLSIPVCVYPLASVLYTVIDVSYGCRRSNVIEGIISEFQRGLEHTHTCNERDSEGAKLLRILETAAEPEVLMAEMSTDQLNSFTKYRAKLEVGFNCFDF